MAAMPYADRSARPQIGIARSLRPAIDFPKRTPILAMSAPTPPRPLDGLMILAIDDHRDTVDMFREYLSSAGATVIGADSARSGLAFAETHTLDGVLVDLRMPGEDGHWFLRQLRASRTVRTPQVPVFAITGERHDLPADPASGFAGSFLKPIELDALVERLKSLPRRAR